MLQSHSPTPIYSFEISPKGVIPLSVEGFVDDPKDTDTFRWLHFDLSDPALQGWTEAHLPPAAASALVQTETRPRCGLLEEGLILNLRGLNLNPGSEAEDMVSVRMWATKSVVISARARRIFALEEIANDISQGRGPTRSSDFVLTLATRLTRRIDGLSIDLDDKTSAQEEALSNGNPVDSTEILELRRSTIKIRRYVVPQREALLDLSDSTPKWLGRDFGSRSREIANRTARTVEELDATRDRLTALQDHLDLQHGLQQARHGHILSVAAGIFLPLTFLTGLFGVNIGGMPGMDNPWAFLWLTLASFGLGIGLFLFLRWRRWF